MKILNNIPALKGKNIRLLYFTVMGFVYMYIFLSAEKSSETSGVSSFSGRTYVWGIILEHWDDSSHIFGHAGAYSVYDYVLENNTRFTFFHAHSIFLQALWDWGLFGLCLMFTTIVVLIKKSLTADHSGFILVAIVVLAGIIEPSWTMNLLSSVFCFELLILKYIFDGPEVEQKNGSPT
jgi:O-antigen ligase